MSQGAEQSWYRNLAYVLAFFAGAAAMYTVEKRGWLQERAVTAERPADSAPKAGPSKKIKNPPEKTAPQTDVLRVAGITMPAPGRYVQLPLATGEAVAFIDVKPGDRIQKGWQVFSHWESPERLQAIKKDVERLRRLLEAAKIRLGNAEMTSNRVAKAGTSASVQEKEDTAALVKVRQSETASAQVAVEQGEDRVAAAEFEFKQAFVTSPIDGIVESVDVLQGERKRPGSAFRGVTILDPRILHCRCDLRDEEFSLLESLLLRHQAASVSATTAFGLNAASRADALTAICTTGVFHQQELRVKVGRNGVFWPARIAHVGITVRPETGLIPVILEIENPKEALRSGVRVEVSFQ